MAKLILSMVLGGIVALILHIYSIFVVKPQKVRSKLQEQGIRGPSPSFLLENIREMTSIQVQALQSAQKKSPKAGNGIAHDWPFTVFQYLHKWIDEYGTTFIYSNGSIQTLCTTDIDIVKKISLCTSLSLGKPSYLSKDRRPLLGQGILSSSGPIWAHQRRIIAPEFYLDKIKDMVNLMVDSTRLVLNSWESRIEKEGRLADINIEEDLRNLSADIISRACFGSNYSEGEEIFQKLRTLQSVMSKATIGIPGLRYMPTQNNREIWKLKKDIDSMILKVVNQRAAGTHEQDLLQMILKGAKHGSDVNEGLPSDVSLDKFIVDNCKNIYFAGHETTAITATWSLMLLAAHPYWQARARAEVLEIYKDKAPSADMFRNMKTLTMVIQETLRLYPPAVFVDRTALEDIEFKDIWIPKGLNLQIPIAILQQSPDLWGPDAHQFNPGRFVNGILGACKSPQAYMPFGIGSRICIGQQFAMTQLKVILSLVLSKFSFSLSPKYNHSPVFKLVVQPENGVHLHLKRLS
ncbi:hypothetical protein HS088_TW17G00380 [Tripterygium wilfordii]|uniref:Cytochrome P450 714C2-like n=1 Tax=Tripterygium wilfordii TaxID=458696 RepID=A0A7J7CFZ3_TRIWF|nr:cytochrome P450 714C2-like [Tripterygium wilfordii]KAF5732847.1 hypothetical protein HS088_TW17G00380 [Tripterygium wilfordii]